MPAPETSDRRQSAVLREVNGVNGYGDHTFADPVELKVRWVSGRRESRRPDGSPVMLEATAIVDRKILIGSLLCLSELEELPPGTSFTFEDLDWLEVVNYNEASDVKNRFTVRQVGLARYKDLLPPVSE